MSTGPIEIDPEHTTFTVKGVEGLVFAISDLDLEIDRDWIDIGDYIGTRIPGLVSYSVTIRAFRVH